jgi:hypothetical protein
MLTLLLFSHSDYESLWNIIEDSIKNLNFLNKIFTCNKTTLQKPKFFEKYIEYDDKLPYFSRLLYNILPNIESDYLLLVHDVQIIINCNENFIKNIEKIMISKNIDRCSLNVFNGYDIVDLNDIQLCNLKNAKGNTLLPYDVCPAIWNKNSFKKLLSLFPNETYRNSELNQNIVKYCKENFNIYGIQKTKDKIYYCIGRPYSENFKVLHITIKNEITFPIEVYMDLINDFKIIYDKYKLKDKLIINNNYNFILKNFKAL